MKLTYKEKFEILWILCSTNAKRQFSEIVQKQENELKRKKSKQRR